MKNSALDLAAMATGQISRRSFLAASGAAGGGLLLTATIPLTAFAPEAAAADETSYPITVYARVAPSGAVTLFAPNPEMGQGVFTSLPMIFAEELGVAWQDVSIEMADYMGGRLMGGQGSGGSLSTFQNWMPLRKAGAAGRQMFITAAAQTWNVSESECNAANSVVTHTPSGKTLTYGALAQKTAALPVPDLEKVKLKDEATFTIIGQSIRDPQKVKVVNGQPLFGIDVKVPGMKYAVFHKGPVFDAAVKSANIEEVKAMPGVSHVFVLKGVPRLMEGPPLQGPPLLDDVLRGGVAIVADTWWHAQKARQALKVEWDEGPHATDSTAGFNAEARKLLAQPPQDSIRVDGDAETALKSAAKVLRADYSYPFISHATLEPQNCTASFKDGKVEIWAPTQSPGAGRNKLAQALGIPADNITIHMQRCGGGFGRRLANDYMIEAAIISREIGAPVKVLWSREDDLQHDFYRPGGYYSLTGGLDAKGKLIALDSRFAGFSRNQNFNRISAPDATKFPAGFVANYSLKASHISFNVPVGMLRAPADNSPIYVFQSFLDELAHAGNRDSIELQLELLMNPLPGEGVLKPGQAAADTFVSARMIPIIERVREMSGWSQRKKLPKGTGLGFACAWSHRGYVAQVHRVSVRRDGTIIPEKVWVAVDIGKHVVNPINAENQVQGSIIDALSATTGQEITIDKGRVTQSNFHEYPLLRNLSSNVPSIEVAFIKSDFQPTGLGEPAYPSTAPAYCNAIFAATGKRVRSLPVVSALKKA